MKESHNEIDIQLTHAKIKEANKNFWQNLLNKLINFLGNYLVKLHGISQVSFKLSNLAQTVMAVNKIVSVIVYGLP